MAHKKQVLYYKSFQDDFVESSNQGFTLDDDYVWIRTGRKARLARSVLYTAARLFALIYGKFILNLKTVRQHVWPYCTIIRPFPATSFDYAVKNNVPAFCMTTTYQYIEYRPLLFVAF